VDNNSVTVLLNRGADDPVVVDKPHYISRGQMLMRPTDDTRR
jgi:hypothetical protein